MRGKILFLLLLLVSFGLGGTLVYYYEDNNTDIKSTTKISNETKSNGVIKCSNEVKVSEDSVSLAVGKIYDATVTVQNYKAGKLSASGSGFIYKKDNKYGYILTNNHVIDGASSVIITTSTDDQVEAEVLGSDKYLDLAVLRISNKYVNGVATIGTSEKSNLGDTVITVGTPIGYEYRGTVTKGTLSGKNRLVEVSIVSTNDFIMSVLQVDAAINPGNSGGPLVNVNGEVIGINSLKLVQDEIEGMGFAIPIEYALKYTDELENGKKIERPFIGITMLNATDTYRLYQSGIMLDKDIDEGVVVVNVSTGSAAEEAGLKKGDVIIAINGNKVSNAAYLKYELYKSQVGETIEIEYIRNSKEKKVNLTLTKLDE